MELRTRLWVERTIGTAIAWIVMGYGLVKMVTSERPRRLFWLGSWWESYRNNPLWWVAAALAGGVAAVCWLAWQGRRRPHQRYRDLPPGTLPASPAGHTVVDDTLQLIPVRFAPPALPVAEAGYLLDGAPKARHLAATLVQLHADKALELHPATPTHPGWAQALTPKPRGDRAAQLVHEELFGREPVRALDAESLIPAFAVLADHCQNQSYDRAWHTEGGRRPAHNAHRLRVGTALQGARLLDDAHRSIGVEAATWAIFNGMAVLSMMVVVLLPVLAPLWGAVAATVLALVLDPAPGGWTRSAEATAFADQVIGFRQYLSQAEAGSLAHQETGGLFTEYLPWAVLFGLADHWARVCGAVVDEVDFLGLSSGSLDVGVSQSFDRLDHDPRWTKGKG